MGYIHIKVSRLERKKSNHVGLVKSFTPLTNIVQMPMVGHAPYLALTIISMKKPLVLTSLCSVVLMTDTWIITYIFF